jgi:hypothetical protein
MGKAASQFDDARRRFARTVAETAADWDDELGRRIRADRCKPIEREATKLAESLQRVDREVAAALRLLR